MITDTVLLILCIYCTLITVMKTVASFSVQHATIGIVGVGFK